MCSPRSVLETTQHVSARCEIKDWRAAVVGPKNSYAERASSGTKQESGVSKLTWYIQ